MPTIPACEATLTMAPWVPLLIQCPGQGGGQEEAAFEVGVKDGVPVLCGQFQGRFGNVDAGAPGMACPSNRSILEARSQSSPKKALDSRLVTSCEVTVRRYLPTQRPPV